MDPVLVSGIVVGTLVFVSVILAVLCKIARKEKKTYIYSQPRLFHKGKYIELATEEEAVNGNRKEAYMPETKTRYMSEYREDRPIHQGKYTNIPASDISSFVKEKQERIIKLKPAHPATRGQSYNQNRDLYRQPFSQVQSMGQPSNGMACAVGREIRANVATKKPVRTGESHAECLGHNSSPVGKRGIAKTRVFHSPNSTFQSIPGNCQVNSTMRQAFHVPVRSDKTRIVADYRPQQPVPYGSSPQMIHSGREVTTKSTDLIYDEPVYSGPARLEKHGQLKLNSFPPFDKNRAKPNARKVFSESTDDESPNMSIQTKPRFGRFSPKDFASQGHRKLSDSKVFVPKSNRQNIGSVAKRKDLESQNRVLHKAVKKNASLSAPVRRLYDISPSLSERSVKDIVEEVKRHAEIENYRPSCKPEEKYLNEIQPEIQRLKNGIQFTKPRSVIKSLPDQDQPCVITPMHKNIRSDKSKEIHSYQGNDAVSTPTSPAKWQNRKLLHQNRLDTSVKPDTGGYFLQEPASQDSRTRSEDKKTRDKMTFSQVNGKAIFEKQLPPTPERQESSSSILSEFPSLPSFITGPDHDKSASAEPNIMSHSLPHEYSEKNRNENIVCEQTVSENQTVGKEVLNNVKSSSSITRHSKVTFAADLVRKEPESTLKDVSDSTKLSLPVLKNKIVVSTIAKLTRTDPEISGIAARSYKLSTIPISSQNRVFSPADDHAVTGQGILTEMPKYTTGASSLTHDIKKLTLAADNEKVKSTEKDSRVDPIVTGQEMQNSKRSSSPIPCKTTLLPVSDNGRCEPGIETELPAYKSTSLETASDLKRLSLATDSYAIEPMLTATDVHYSGNSQSQVSDFETGMSQIGIEKLNTQATRIEDHKTSGSTAQMSGKKMVSETVNEQTRAKPHITENEIPKYKGVTLPTTRHINEVLIPTITDTRLKDSKPTDSAQVFTRKSPPPVSNGKRFTPAKGATRSASPVRDNAISDYAEKSLQITTDGFPFHGQSQFSQRKENQRNVKYDRLNESQRASLNSNLSETSFSPQRTSTPLKSSVDIRYIEKSNKSVIRNALHQRRLRIGNLSVMSDDGANMSNENETNYSAKTFERNQTIDEAKISAVMSRPYQGIQRIADEQDIGAFIKEVKTKHTSSSSFLELLFQDERKRQRVPIEEQRRIKTIGESEQTGNETNVLEIPRNEKGLSAITENKRIKSPETKIASADPGDTRKHYITEYSDKASAPPISSQKIPSQKRSSSPIRMSINEKDIKTEAATSSAIVPMNTEGLQLAHDSQRNIFVPNLRKPPSADFDNKIVVSTEPKVATVDPTTTKIEVRNHNRSSSPLSSEERPPSSISTNRSEEDIGIKAQAYKTSPPAVSTNTEDLPLAHDSQELKSQHTVKDVSHERTVRSPVNDPLETVVATDLQFARVKNNSDSHPSLPVTSQEKALPAATDEGKAKPTNTEKEYTKMPSSTGHEKGIDIFIANRIHQQRAAKDELYSRKSPPPVPIRKRRLSTGRGRKRSASPVHENAISDYVDGLLENISVGLPILNQSKLLEPKEDHKSTSYDQTKEKPRICPSISKSELCVNEHETSTLLQMSVNIPDKENSDQSVFRDASHRRRLCTADSSTTPEDAASLTGDTEAHDSAKIPDLSKTLHEVLTSAGISKKIKYIHKIANEPDIEVLLKQIKAKRASSSSLADLLCKDEQKRQHKEPAQEQRRVKTMDVGKLTGHTLSTPNKAVSQEAEVPITCLEKVEMQVTKTSPSKLPKNKKLSLDTDSKRVAVSDITAARLVTKITEMDGKCCLSPISNKERTLPRIYDYSKSEQYVRTDTLLSATVNDMKEMSSRTGNDRIKPCSSATDFLHSRKPLSPSVDHETAPPVTRLENVEVTRIEECSGGLSMLPITSQLPSVKDKIKTQRKVSKKDYTQLTLEIPNHEKEERSATDNQRKLPQPSVTDELQHRKSPQLVTSPTQMLSSTFGHKRSPSPDQDNDICNYVEAVLKALSEEQPVCSQSQISKPEDNQINATHDQINSGPRIFVNSDVSKPSFSQQNSSLTPAGHIKEFSSATDHAIKDRHFTAEDIPDSRKSPSLIIGNNMLLSTETVFARVDPSTSRAEVHNNKRSPSPDSGEIRTTCIIPSVDCDQTDQEAITEAHNTKMSQTAMISKNDREPVNDHAISDYVNVLLEAISEEFPVQNQASPAEIIKNQKELHDSKRIKSQAIATEFSNPRPMMSSVTDHETENKELQAITMESHSGGQSQLPGTSQKMVLQADTDEIGIKPKHFEKENPKLLSTARRNENEVSILTDDKNKHQKSIAKEKPYSRKSPPPVPYRKKRLSSLLDHNQAASLVHDSVISDYVDRLLENIADRLPGQSESQVLEAKESQQITVCDRKANVISDKEAHDPAKIPDLSNTLNEVLTSSGISKKIKKIHRIADDPDIDDLLKVKKAKRASTSSNCEPLLKDEVQRQQTEQVQQHRHMHTSASRQTGIDTNISYEAACDSECLLQEQDIGTTKLSPSEL